MSYPTMCYTSRPVFVVFPYVTQNVSDSQTLNSEAHGSQSILHKGLCETPELRVLRREVCTYSCRSGSVWQVPSEHVGWIQPLHEVMATGTVGHLAYPTDQQIKCSPGQGIILLCTLGHSMKW